MAHEDCYDMFSTLVRGGKTPQEAYAALLRMLGEGGRGAVEAALQKFREETRRITGLDKPRSLRRDWSVPGWYQGPSERDRYWPALKRYLLEKGKGRDAAKVESIDQASTKIVSLLEHPAVGSFTTKGLVLGYVQSGKTANFTAVIAKAADAGYRLFIVLSGLHNLLRNQTQGRLDSELWALNQDFWIGLTNPLEDFPKNSHNLNVGAFLSEKANHKVLCVVKKNATRLGRLERWLKKAPPEVLRSCPTLIIDDEADQASINTGPIENRTAVNRRILEILGTLPKAAYIGYTATPFANVFIDPMETADLYPRDFIVDLPKPEGYFGPELIFGRDRLNNDQADEELDGLDIVRIIDPDEIPSLKPASREARHAFEPDMTPSLRQATLYFWMATAARECRGHVDEHSSMLVHTTLYADVHERFRPLIELLTREVLSGLTDDRVDLIRELRTLWEAEMERVDRPPDHKEVTFDELRGRLHGVVDGTEIVIENSRSLIRLDYEHGRKIVIVIGGNTLSRGLTLEGLVVSFFIRTSSAYDTLLQMGRWFGYRRGYMDLPRVWMTEELYNYFHDLATVEQEIRYDIDVYETEHKTPLEFGVRVRTHPQLAITSRLKMGAAISCQVSYANERLQTINFNNRDAAWLQGNLAVARNLIREVLGIQSSAENPDGSRHIFRNIPSDLVLKFISAYRFHENSAQLRSDLISEYIMGENALGLLTSWNVVVMSQEKPLLGEIDLGFGNVPLIRRSRLKQADTHADIKALMSRIDWAADSERPSGELQAMTVAELKKLRPKNNPGALLLYPISKDSPPADPSSRSRVPMGAVEHVLGVGLVFPGVDRDLPVKYMTVDLSGLRNEELEFVDENDDTEP